MTPGRHALYGTLLRVIVFGASIATALALIPERMTLGLFVFFIPLIVVDRAWTFMPITCSCGQKMKRQSGRPVTYGCPACGHQETATLNPEE